MHGNVGNKNGQLAVKAKGEASAKYQPEGVCYQQAHKRIWHARGKAKEHKCACGAQAQEWAYDHEDPNEDWFERGDKMMAYSCDVDYYIPMCIRCHRQFDAMSTFGRPAASSIIREN